MRVNWQPLIEFVCVISVQLVSIGPDYFSALNLNFLLQIATLLLTYAPQQVFFHLHLILL